MYSHRHLFLVGALAAGMLVPVGTQAATFESGRFLTFSTTTASTSNVYLAAGEVQVNSPVTSDLSATGGTVMVNAPIGADALLAGGTVDLQKPVAGDARIAGGRVAVQDSVGGDLAVAGGIVTVNGKATDTHIVGGTVQVTNGSNGPVTIYGMDVTLSGTFAGDVDVVASDKISVSPDTVIHGVFKYNAPQQADIPDTAVINGGVNYIGSAAFLPTVQQARTFAVAGLWIFILVRLIAAVVAAGLIAGIFPELAVRITEETLTRGLERSILYALLGFASFIAVPVLLIILVASFVGIGLAFVIGAGYLLFLLLAYLYAAVITGAALIRLFKRDLPVTWRTAIVGVFALGIIGIIPVLGFVARVVLMALAGGALLTLFYKFAFRRTMREPLDI